MQIALIRNTYIQNIIVSTLAYAQTLGYDEVGVATFTPAGVVVNGTLRQFAPEPNDVINRKAIENLGRNALDSLRAYNNTAIPTNTQTVAVVKLLCRVCIGLIRVEINDFDSDS